MKRPILLIIAFCLLIAQFGYAQGKKKKPQPKVPPVVLQAFNTKYPELKPKDWDWEAEKEIYEADFMQDGKEREATFTVGGKWVKTKTDITQAELPAAVSKAATTGEMSAWTITDLSQVESADKGMYYKLRFKKGQEQKSLKFDTNGNQLEKKTGQHKTTPKM